MAIIEKEIELVGSKGRKKSLFDSGATYSCIRRELANVAKLTNKGGL